MNDLLAAWRQLRLAKPPFALPQDLAVLSNGRVATFTSFESYAADGLEDEDDSNFHLGLLPQPWFGDLKSATAFILMLNPGLNPGDYYAEYRVPSYRRALIANLRQERGREYPLLFLDPELSWHPGARYFRGKLHWLALALVRQKNIKYRKALAQIAQRICVLQLVPYHSPRFRLSNGALQKLHSAALAKAFIHNTLRTRSDILVLVTRKAEQWELPKCPGVVIKYRRSQTRAAHLSPNSPGGRALARHFKLRAN